MERARGGGGTDLEREYGDVRPWRPPFHASPAACKGPISSKRVSSQDPLLRKFGNFSLNSLNFHPNFSSQAPKFGNFQLTSPQIWKFSAHKPPNLEIFPLTSPPFQRQMSVHKPHTSEIRAAHPLPEKKLNPPPPRGSECWVYLHHCTGKFAPSRALLQGWYLFCKVPPQALSPSHVPSYFLNSTGLQIQYGYHYPHFLAFELCHYPMYPPFSFKFSLWLSLSSLPRICKRLYTSPLSFPLSFPPKLIKQILCKGGQNNTEHKERHESSFKYMSKLHTLPHRFIKDTLT